MNAGLYVHVPFCLTRCGYCDFNAHAGLDHLKLPFADAVRREADAAAPGWAGVRFASVFLGGGTPTTLAPEVLGGILRHLRGRFDVAPDAEVTCEANPDTVDEASLAALREHGVNRLSLGVQSFDEGVLRSLERAHSADAARRAFRAARRAGFENVSLDLIYGAAGESPASWQRTLAEAIDLSPEHLSAYALTLEPGTPLSRRVAAGRAVAPDPDRQTDAYLAACAALGEAGYRHYEVSNWSRPERECLHNLGYWTGRPYLGLGPGAHSFRGRRRWWNVRSPARYVGTAASGVLPVEGEERLSPEDAGLERLLLGLRLADGVPRAWLGTRASGFVERGLARLENGRFVLTEPGMFLANEVVLEVVG